ncbi:MAG: AtpZ/AtpI family protein [SAR324 cluster bacterium]|nr:AtpZ/AtpI family protein [SAR324 cluster bacterium]
MSQKDPNHIKYGKLSSIGIEMGLSVVAGVFIGNWLDEYLGTEPYMLIFWTIAGFGAAVKAIISAIKDWEKQIQADKQKETKEEESHDD